MAQLRQDYAEFTARQAEVIVVGPDDAVSFRYHWDADHYPFIGLPDPHHEVADLYGQEIKFLKLGRMPALLVIDRAGIVRSAHYGKSMSDIMQNWEVLRLLDRLNREK